MKKRIAVVGANGQVGSEVCLLLSLMDDVEPVPVCRSQIASAFLRRCGLTVRHGNPSDPVQARELLDGCDLVADFTLPTGSASEVKKAMRQLIPSLSAAAPPQAAFAYLSSITAFGIPDFHHRLTEYRFSRNMYGACKREGERLALGCARQNRRPGFVLRVGVVHGELQAVSRQMWQQVHTTAGLTTCVPDAPSYTVFAFSIAETLAAIAHGRETPGRYTMLSNPAWSWRDLHEWYCRRASVEPRIRLLTPDPAPGLARRTMNACLTPFTRLAFSSKDLISSYLAASSPAFENQLRAVYHSRTAAREIAAGARAAEFRPYGNNHTDFPGQRIRTISDSRLTMEPYAARVRETVQSVTRYAGSEMAGGAWR